MAQIRHFNQTSRQPKERNGEPRRGESLRAIPKPDEGRPARSQLEPSLEREGAGGRLKPSLGKEGWVVVKKKGKEGWLVVKEGKESWLVVKTCDSSNTFFHYQIIVYHVTSSL